LGDVQVPQQVLLKLLSGGDVQVGFASGDYPFRLSGVSDFMFLRLNVEGLAKEVTTITATADTFAVPLSGKYFVMREYSDAQVYVWFNTPGVAASGTITHTVSALTNNSTVTVNGKVYEFVSYPTTEGQVEVGGGVVISLTNLAHAINLTGTPGVDYVCAAAHPTISSSATVVGDAITLTAKTLGAAGNSLTLEVSAGHELAISSTLTGGRTASTAPAVTTQRLLPVVIPPDSTAIAVSIATAAALNADIAFNCPVPTTANFVATAASPGLRTTAGIGTSGWTAPVKTTAGASYSDIHVKSDSTSEVLVGIAPL
jgi:hypothetical protein